MTKQYKKYHNQLDDVLQALMKTYKNYEPLEIIHNNLKEKISMEQLELVLVYFQTLIFCARCEKTYQIMFRGILFLEEGGFSKTIKDDIAKYRATIAKTIMISINAIAILVITALGVWVTYKSDGHKDNLEILKNKTDSLTSIIYRKDSLIKILISDTIKRR